MADQVDISPAHGSNEWAMALIERFRADPNNRDIDWQDAMRPIQHPRDHRPLPPPGLDIDERIEHAQTIQEFFDNRPLKHIVGLSNTIAAVCLLISIERLRAVAYECRTGEAGLLLSTWEYLAAHKLFKDGWIHSTSGASSPAPSASTTSRNPAGGSTGTSRSGRETATSKKDRDIPEKRRALNRDGKRCILTRSQFVDGSHIVPFSANKNLERLGQAASALRCFHNYTDSEVQERSQELVLSAARCSDKWWNILALSRNAHQASSENRFALHPLGLEPADTNTDTESSDLWHVMMQLRWMNLREWSPAEEARSEAISLADRLRDMSSNRYLPGPPPGCELPDVFGKQVNTGDIASVAMPLEDAQKMVIALKIAAANAELGAMSGAAVALLLEKDFDDYAPAGEMFIGQRMEQIYALRESWDDASPRQESPDFDASDCSMSEFEDDS